MKRRKDRKRQNGRKIKGQRNTKTTIRKDKKQKYEKTIHSTQKVSRFQWIEMDKYELRYKAGQKDRGAKSPEDKNTKRQKDRKTKIQRTGLRRHPDNLQWRWAAKIEKKGGGGALTFLIYWTPWAIDWSRSSVNSNWMFEDQCYIRLRWYCYYCFCFRISFYFTRSTKSVERWWWFWWWEELS